MADVRIKIQGAPNTQERAGGGVGYIQRSNNKVVGFFLASDPKSLTIDTYSDLAIESGLKPVPYVLVNNDDQVIILEQKDAFYRVRVKTNSADKNDAKVINKEGWIAKDLITNRTN